MAGMDAGCRLSNNSCCAFAWPEDKAGDAGPALFDRPMWVREDHANTDSPVWSSSFPHVPCDNQKRPTSVCPRRGSPSLAASLAPSHTRPGRRPSRPLHGVFGEVDHRQGTACQTGADPPAPTQNRGGGIQCQFSASSAPAQCRLGASTSVAKLPPPGELLFARGPEPEAVLFLRTRSAKQPARLCLAVCVVDRHRCCGMELGSRRFLPSESGWWLSVCTLTR